MAVRQWPEFPEEQRWILDSYDELIADSTRTPAQKIERAAELRARAAELGPFSGRDPLLAIAERYEAAPLPRRSLRLPASGLHL